MQLTKSEEQSLATVMMFILVIGVLVGIGGTLLVLRNPISTDDQNGLTAGREACVSTFDDLLDAIEWVESKGSETAHPDHRSIDR